MKNTTKKMTKGAALLLAASMMAAMPAAAKTVSSGKTYAKAKAVKAGKTTIKQKSGKRGYVKFTATASKTFKFTLNNLRCTGDFQNVYANANFTSGGEWKTLTTKQNKKKTTTLWLTTARNWANTTNKKVTYSTNIPSRTASFRLAKGQTVVLYLYGAASGKTFYYDLKIK